MVICGLNEKLDLYMSCGVREYWIVNPINREVTIYSFNDKDITASTTYRKNEMAKSYCFEGLTAELERIFKRP